MRLTLSRSELVAALDRVRSVVASVGIHPIYESVRIKLSGDPTALTIAGTDLETSMVATLPRWETTGGGGFDAAVRIHRLVDVLRAMDGERVTLEAASPRSEVIVECGGATARLHAHDPEDFPDVVDAVGASATSAWIRGPDLRRALEQATPAAARERTRYALNGVLIRAQDGAVEFVATDGRRLHIATVESSRPGDAVNAIIPTRTIAALLRVLADDEVRIDIVGAEGARIVRFSALGVVVRGRLLDGEFPRYRDVVPKETKRTATATRATLAAAVARAKQATNRDNPAVYLDHAAGGMTVTARSAEASIEERVACDLVGEPIKIGFNPEYLGELFAALRGDVVALATGDRRSPALVSEPGFIGVVMPVTSDDA